METFKDIEKYILSFDNTRLDYPFGEEVAVYKVMVGDDEKMFALMPEGQSPVRLSLKCDPTLATLLREKYESVQQGYHLNKKHWNTVLVTGQLEEQELKDLIVHSYNLVTGTHDIAPDFS